MCTYTLKTSDNNNFTLPQAFFNAVGFDPKDPGFSMVGISNYAYLRSSK